MSGKILIVGGYLILDSAYSGIVLQTNTRIKCHLEKANDIELQTKFGLYPESPNKFINACIQTCKAYLQSVDIKFIHFKGTVEADERFYINNKLGLGSSSALCTALVSSMLVLHGITDSTLLFKIASLSHFKAQGNIGSGFDIAASVYGHCIYKKPLLLEDITMDQLQDIGQLINQEWFIQIKKISWPKEWKILMFTHSNGQDTPSSSKKYLEWRSNSINSGCLSILDKIHWTIQSISQAIDTSDPISLKVHFTKLLKDYRELGELCGINIVPESCFQFFTSIFKLPSCIGGMCPGAGGDDAIFVVCLQHEAIVNVATQYNFDWVNINIPIDNKQ